MFYELLRGQTEQTIEICGGYPVNLAENVTDLLKSAVHNEMQEFEDVYPEFAKIAKEEGFDQASGAFDMIAKVEAVHGRRFALLAELLGKISILKSRWRRMDVYELRTYSKRENGTTCMSKLSL